MSACSQRIEFAIRMAHETGAPAHQLMPLLRRLHRLATTHARRCEIACNGCRTCGGCGVGCKTHALIPGDRGSFRADPRGTDPCPTCSTDTVEDAIRRTCGELDKLRAEHSIAWRIDAVLNLREELQLGPKIPIGRVLAVDRAFRELREATERSSGTFSPIFQHDPRGATVRIRVPSGASNTLARDVLCVPTSGRV